MEYNKLPGTDIEVSKICLGTMTWGTQNTKQEAFEQMDYAIDNGVNFFDTAELYPVPASADTYATTEVYIGKWLESRKSRDKIILASKIAGPGDYTAHIRKTGFKDDSIEAALDQSLKRLKTDYLDLYLLHWPERLTNYFGNRNFKYFNDSWEDNFQEILLKLKKVIDSGKVRHVGLSNENPWGIMKFLEYSKNELPKMITIQNPYSLLNRLFEIGSGEICKRENVGLLAYSPLGYGVLTGKYRNGNVPKNSRLTLFPTMARYTNDNCKNATELYHQIAEKHNLTLTQLALAFVNDRPFVTSTIIGATNMEQLKENIDSINTKLSKEIIDEINLAQEKIPNPAP
ncbi:MAG TPA: aldo/keto reductase [Flavobacteriaceae bacterium]|jgi:aryl-alcohol dehydrogenase-like predicted oxidoreductase|nr:aldo/keto reductase [Flavobacteriaceae bacterium]HJO70249.1 aldo/keto reductase [Flavobacteriaceae bacterium]|tara:strand:- start:1637 stop:2668 length:1032 start_codon:yes stop_codon:yes gene_type:complete